jgi:hypothetical protein
MPEHVDRAQGSANLIDAQYGRQRLDPLGFEKPYGGPVSPEGVFIEELDATEGDSTGDPGPSGHIGAVEEILPQFLLRDQVWGLMIVFSQFADGPGVGFLGSG